MEKVYRDVRTQIGILQSRGIIIKNKKLAKKLIEEINYYNLINGYKKPFILQTSPYEKYLPGTTFEEIYALYEFDRKLRILTLEYLLIIEKHIKSIISQCFSKKYGHKNYLAEKNFDNTGASKYSDVCKLLCTIYKKIDLSRKEPSIYHYVNGKNYVPLWVVVNTLSIGDTSKFYSNMLQVDRNDIAKKIKWGLKENELISCLSFISDMRNRCAHDMVLYNYIAPNSLFNNKYFRYFRTKNNKNYFALMIAFKILLSKSNYQMFSNELEILLSSLSNSLKVISKNKILSQMGLPHNWKRLNELNFL